MRSTADEVNNYVWFVLKKEFMNQASSSFILDYTDLETGERVFYKDHSRGTPKRYYFSPRSRKLRFNKNQKELIELVKNHPLCEGSPNGTYRYDPVEGKNIHLNARFKMIDDEGDAQVSISAAKLLNDAMNRAFEIVEDQELMLNVATILGIKDKSVDLTFDKILVYIDRDPQSFLDVVNSKDLEAKALAKKALEASVFSRNSKGHLMLGDFDYGMDEEDVIQTLKEDVDKRMFLQRKFGIKSRSFKTDEEVKRAEKIIEEETELAEKEKAKRGRPPKKS